jgi:hypothetical protein
MMAQQSKYASKRAAKFRSIDYERVNLNDAAEVVKAWDRQQEAAEAARKASRDSWWRKEHEAQLEEHIDALRDHARAYAPVILPANIRQIIKVAKAFDGFRGDGDRYATMMGMVASFDTNRLAKAVTHDDTGFVLLHFVSDDDAVEFRLRYL